MPPVLKTPAELVAKFSVGLIDTGGKFAAGVVDTGGNFAGGVIEMMANLPLVLLIPVVHLDLQIFEKTLK